LGNARDAVGVDIGQSSVKLVCARRSGNGFAVTRAEMLAISDVAGVEGTGPNVRDALADAARRIGARPGAVVASLERSAATVRILSVPTAAGEELARVVRYEAESQIPFPIEAAELAHVPLTTSNGQARVLLTACPRTSVTQRRELMADAGLAPTEVAVSTLATLEGLSAIDSQMAQETCLVVDVGAEITEVAIARGGEPAASFTLALGGRSLTLALANDLGLDLSVAERRKVDEGISLDPATGLPLAASQENLAAWVQRLYTGLRRALESHAQADPSDPVASVVLLGSGGLTRGLAEGLVASLRLPLRYADPAGALGFAVPEGSSSTGFVTALGLALQGLGLSGYAMDLTPREVLAAGRARTQRGVWTGAAVVFGVALLAATAYQGLRTSEAHRAYAAAGAELRTKMAAASELDLSDVETQALEGILIRAEDKTNDPLDILAYLSTNLPAEVRLKDLTFARGDSVGIKGEALSNRAISDAQHELEKSARFRDILLNHSTATDVAGRTLYTFDIQCKLGGGEAQ
jgi:type IV pilus assembly protein PilM